MELASPEQQQRDRDGDGDIKSIISTSQVHLRPNDPFDLEAYIAPYTGGHIMHQTSTYSETVIAQADMP